MIDLDGRQYTVLSPSENTANMVTRINAFCSDNNIRNSKDEIIEIEVNYASPLYLILWGLGYLVTAIQNLVYAVAKGFNVQTANEDQLLNLAGMAGLKRGSASLTTFMVKVRAMSESDARRDPNAHEGNLVISSTDTVTYQGIVYKPALHPDITITPDSYGYFVMVAQTAGSYEIAANVIQGFDSSIANLASFEQFTSIPGQQEESIASLRERLQRRQYSGTTVDACMDAIRALEGITIANIVYNTSNITPKVIGQITIPPRYAALFVQGYNENIGKTYWEHLSAPTIPEDPNTHVLDYSNVPAERILDTQFYTTHAQQQLPVLILTPDIQELYVNIYVGIPITGDEVLAMQDALASYLSQNTVIGQSITSAMVLNSLKDFAAYNLLGAMVSSDGNIYAYKTAQHEDVLWHLNTENINVIMPEVAD